MTVTGMTWQVTYFITGMTFLSNVQLGQLFHRRDAVDHAAAIAADTAKKTYCANQESSSASESAIQKAIDPVMQTVGGQQACKVEVQPSGTGSDPGSQDLDVNLDCQFPCNVPVAAQVMCHGGKANFKAKKKTASMGCDGQGQSGGQGT
jgi:hypothetical protein